MPEQQPTQTTCRYRFAQERVTRVLICQSDLLPGEGRECDQGSGPVVALCKDHPGGCDPVHFVFGLNAISTLPGGSPKRA